MYLLATVIKRKENFPHLLGNSEGSDAMSYIENTLSFTSSSLDGHVSLLCIRATPRSTDTVLTVCLYDSRGIED